jgi:hypothetical protein
MIKGTVESIAKASIVVSIESEVKTLTGTAVEALAPTVKLGDVLEFDSVTDLKTIRIAPKEKAQPAPKRASGSPTPAFVGRKVQF